MSRRNLRELHCDFLHFFSYPPNFLRKVCRRELTAPLHYKDFSFFGLKDPSDPDSEDEGFVRANLFITTHSFERFLIIALQENCWNNPMGLKQDVSFFIFRWRLCLCK